MKLGFLPLLVALLTAGCGTPGAIFVTKSSLAIADIDSTPAEMTIAMHRVEGFIAPRNTNGNTPPVLAHITSNRDMLAPEVKQVYATGTAAERIAGDFRSNNSECKDCVDEIRKDKTVSPVVFSTSTTVGLRIGLSTENVIDGVVLGYRRKEMSFVPSLAKDKQGTYRYPSLIAAIHLNSGDSNSPFRACQGFATGTAATRLAESDDAGLGCLDASQSVKGLLTSKKNAELRQQAEIARVLRCYVALSDEPRRVAVRLNATQLGIFPPATPVVRTGADAIDLKTAARSDEDSRYALHLLGAIVTEGAKGENTAPAMLREQMLRAHREVVCASVPEASAQ